MRQLAIRILAVMVCVFCLLQPAGAYSVLSHEEIVDMAWKDRIVPMLRSRFPGITEDDLRRAHAYAYGGSVIQDIGYYPFGSHYFSDLVHYVRPGEFVNALIRDSTTPNEYAFALGALAHFCGDSVGHPVINRITAEENPPLSRRFGHVVTYGQDPTAHIRTEFGFDVVEVAQGHYSQENYRDFIGFQVAKPLLDRAFEETYGIPIVSVMPHEELAISSYRRSVSSLIPKLTRIAFVSYRKQIRQASPGMEKRKFLYRLNRTEFNHEFGTDEYHVGIGGHIAAFFLHIVPKVGPFKALKVTLADPQQQSAYIKSMNDSVDAFRRYLGEIHAAPAPLPPPDPAAAEDAHAAARKLKKDLTQARRDVAEEPDSAEKAKLEKVAQNVARTAELATETADRTDSRIAVDEAAHLGLIPPPASAVPPGTPVQPPTTPQLPNVDLDTGQPSTQHEYVLADQTYSHLREDLADAATPVDPAISGAIRSFFDVSTGSPVPQSADRPPQ